MAAAVAAIGPKNPPQVERTAVEAALTPSTGTAERGVTLVMLDRRKGGKPITLGARQGLC